MRLHPQFRRITLAALCVAILSSGAQAGLFDKAFREAGEYAFKKFGAKAAIGAGRSVGPRMSSLAAKHGDDVLRAVKKVGPKAVKLVEEAGQRAPQVARLLAKHGDDAARWVFTRPTARKLFERYGDDAAAAMIKHKGIAEPLIGAAGGAAVLALNKITERSGRRLAMMAAEGGAEAAVATSPKVMQVIASHGDEAMDFIWRNRTVLASSAALAAFLNDPKPYIDGANDLAATAAGAPRK